MKKLIILAFILVSTSACADSYRVQAHKAQSEGAVNDFEIKVYKELVTKDNTKAEILARTDYSTLDDLKKTKAFFESQLATINLVIAQAEKINSENLKTPVDVAIPTVEKIEGQ